MAMITGRPLHYVFKIGDRKSSYQFFKNILGMSVLRHEEFTEGCEAACNGPYDNRWSKTMMGYGDEDQHFVFELTYNYPVKSYAFGNDFIGITIKSSDVIKRAKEHNWNMELLNSNNHIKTYLLKAPDGYNFYIIDDPIKSAIDPVVKVTLASSDLAKSIVYWKGILDLHIFNQTNTSVSFGYKEGDTLLEFKLINEPINRAEAFGRIAFSVLHDIQPIIRNKIKKADATILTPLIKLDTPGKAAVRVIILADPDGHEICFVDDENFRLLSEFDPRAQTLIERYMEKDLS